MVPCQRRIRHKNRGRYRCYRYAKCTLIFFKKKIFTAFFFLFFSKEFPRVPTGITKQFIVDEADTRLALYSFLEETDQSQLQPQPEAEPTVDEKGAEKESKEQQKDKDQAAPTAVVPVPPPVPKLPSHVVDAPLVRLYNFLRK